MDRQEKIAILRQYEPYCYQICHYLLQREPQASRAAEATLLKIAADARFFTDSDDARREKVLRTSIRASLLRQGKSDTM